MIKKLGAIILLLLLYSCATIESPRVLVPGFEEKPAVGKTKVRSYGVNLGINDAEKNIQEKTVIVKQPVHTDSNEKPAYDLAEILSLEISANRDLDKAAAVKGMMEYAQTYNDRQIAKRAYEISLFMYDNSVARDAAELWYKLDYESRNAQGSYIKELIESSDYKLAFELMARRIEQGRPTDFRLIANFHQFLDEEQARGLIRTFIAYIDIYPEKEQNLNEGLSIAYYRLADFLFYQGEMDKSLRLLNLIISSKKFNINENLRQNILELKGRIYYLTKYSNAEVFYIKSLQTIPQSYSLGIYYVLYLNEQGQKVKAEKELINLLEKQLIAREKSDSVFFLALGAQQIGMRKALVKALNYLHNLADKDNSALRIGMIAMATQNYALAEDSLSRVSSSSKLSYNAAWLRLQATIKLNDFEAGRSILEEVINNNRREYVLLVGKYAGELAKIGKLKEAEKIMDNAVQQLPLNENIILSYAFAYYEANKLSAMKEKFERAMEISSESDTVKNSYGYSLSDKDIELERAKLLIDEAIQAKPTSPAYVDSLGWWYFRKGELNQAEVLLNWAYRQKQDSEIAAHLGEVLWHLGKVQRAKYIWLNAYQIDTQSAILKNTMSRFKVNWQKLNFESSFFSY